MEIVLKINKENAEDCPWSCPFRVSDYDNQECTLFNEKLNNVGHPDSREYEACFRCQEMYDNTKVKGE